MRILKFVLVVLTFFAASSLLGEEAVSDSARQAALKKFYRPVGFSIGVVYNRLSGVGARSVYVEETDSYDASRADGKSMLGFSFGLQVWKQRTQFQLELAWSRGEFLEEGGFRNTTNGGTVDTYIDIGYFMAGFRMKQALITRRILATGGIALVEEGRTRHAKEKSKGRPVDSRNFPADEFYLWSLGGDIQLSPGLYLGYSYSWTYNQDDFDPIFGRIDDPPIIVDGFTSHSIQLTLVY